MLVSALCALAVVVALAVALPLSLLLQAKATHAGPLNWTECGSVGAILAWRMPVLCPPTKLSTAIERDSEHDGLLKLAT